MGVKKQTNKQTRKEKEKKKRKEKKKKKKKKPILNHFRRRRLTYWDLDVSS